MFAKTARIAATAALLAVVSLSAAEAQQAPAKPGAAPAAAPLKTDFPKDHLASAKAAIDASHMFNNLEQILVGVTLQTKATLTKNSPSLGPQIDEVTNKVAIDLAAKRPELDRQIQIVWANRFTKAELDDLTKFLNSPIGQKWTQELPNVIAGSGQTIQVWQRQLADEMLQKSRDELIKRGAKL